MESSTVEYRDTEARTDLWPSPMPAKWQGTLVVQRSGAFGFHGEPVWMIVSNNAPIYPRKRSVNRVEVVSFAAGAIVDWLVAVHKR